MDIVVMLALIPILVYLSFRILKALNDQGGRAEVGASAPAGRKGAFVFGALREWFRGH
jgi:hypothetical protein